MHDQYIFADEDTLAKQNNSEKTWHILSVDDDTGVHDITRMALANFDFEGDKIKFSSVNSAQEAKAYMQMHQDVALILLDVVMETQNAGFEVAQYVRDELKNHCSRIIMRTGQPGNLNVEEVIRRYDIDGFNEKTDLTRERFFTTVYSALRSYRDINTIKELRDKFIDLVYSIRSLHKVTNMNELYALLLEHFNGLLSSADSMYLIKQTGEEMEVLISSEEEALIDPQMEMDLAKVKSFQKSIINEGFCCSYLQLEEQIELYLYVRKSIDSDPTVQMVFQALSDDINLMYKLLYLQEKAKA